MHVVCLCSQTECDDWMRTAKILLSKLMNEPIHDLFPVKMEEKKEAKSVSLTLPTDQEYVDQEKLVPTGEEQAQTTQVKYNEGECLWNMHRSR